MPDEEELIVPWRYRYEEHAEYSETFGQEAVKLPYFCRVLRTAPELKHIARARPKLNFQGCKVCTVLQDAVMSALKSGDKVALALAKARRAQHLAQQRAERLCYYARAGMGRDSTTSCVSMIIDKWDSAKTTVPYFARSMTWWKEAKHNVLEQHVVGVLVHSEPNQSYLYTINDSIGGGANLNVEALRRTVLHLYSNSPLPRKMCINADNASDNKCWTLLLFLAMLVYHRYTEEVRAHTCSHMHSTHMHMHSTHMHARTHTHICVHVHACIHTHMHAQVILSFLIVGHTHEDIDQLFSVLSRYLKKIGKVMGPSEFQSELQNALYASERTAHLELLQAVIDWDAYLRPHLVDPAPVGIQHADLSGESKKSKAGGKSTEGSSVDGAAETQKEVRIPHLFWIHRRSDETVVLHYKEFAAHSVFLPKKRGSDPAVTDPDGIVLFGSPPGDPMVTPPKECELRSVKTL